MEVAGVLLLAALVVLGHATWLARHRSSVALDIDEQHLVSLAEDDREALHDDPGSIARWPLSADAVSPVTAPGVPLATAAALDLFGYRPLAAMAPILLASALLTVAAWAVARQLGAEGWSLLAATLVSLAPVVVWFSRSAHHIVPAAACLTSVVALGLQTDALRRRGWSIALGIAIGLSLLVRTMLIAAVPWALGGWVVLAIVRRRIDRTQLANLGFATLAAVAVAAWWWLPNHRTAVSYLADGPVTSDDLPWWDPTLEARRLGRVVAGIEAYDLAWAVTVALGCLVAISLVGAVRRRALTERDAYVGVVLAATFGALVLAKDDFPGFFLLVAGPGIPWAVAVTRRSPWRPIQQAALALWAVLALVGLLRFPQAGASWYDVQAPKPAGGGDPSLAWGDLYETLAKQGADDAVTTGCPVRIAVPQGDDLLTSGHLRWALLVDGEPGRNLELRGIWPSADLAQEARRAERDGTTVVLIEDGPTADLAAATVRRAIRPDFRRVRTAAAPDGRRVEVWRPRTPLSC